MLIRPVAHSPHLPLVAAWLHAEWWAAGGHALEETEAFLHRATGPGLPCALVAERDGVALGTATLHLPLTARRWPASSLSKVDLPQPFGPRTATRAGPVRLSVR